VITHRMHVDQFEDGFKALNAGEAAKVVLSW
jgi:threonine dehydrogenase-like Zn-dependent dehydrogenase